MCIRDRFKDYPELKSKIEFFVQNFSQSAMGISDDSATSDNIMFEKREASPYLPNIMGYYNQNTVLNKTDTIDVSKAYSRQHYMPPKVILPGSKVKKNPNVEKNIHEKFIQKLLRPKDYINNMNNQFAFTSDEVLQVIKKSFLMEAL